MASYQNQYGATPKVTTDELGNPITTETREGVYTRTEQHQEKGMMDKIKEKLPGTEEHRHASRDERGYTGTEHGQDKGMMEKIKEKLPGTGTGTGTGTGAYDDPAYSSHSHTTPTATPYGDTTYTGSEEHGREKKGITDKIKDKLAGGNH